MQEEVPKERWHSLAEKVAAFEKRTRSSPRLAAAKQDALQLTSPQVVLRHGLPPAFGYCGLTAAVVVVQSPELATHKRQRPSHMLSREQEEVAYMASVEEKRRSAPAHKPSPAQRATCPQQL